MEKTNRKNGQSNYKTTDEKSLACWAWKIEDWMGSTIYKYIQRETPGKEKSYLCTGYE